MGVTAWDQSPKLPVFVLWVRVEANAQGPWGPIASQRVQEGPEMMLGPLAVHWNCPRFHFESASVSLRAHPDSTSVSLPTKNRRTYEHQKSPGVSNLAHFQHVLLTSFQVRFLLDFVTFLRPSEAPFGTIFEKRTIPKIASKKGDPPLENGSLSPCPMAPRDAASRAHFSTVTIARAQIVVRIRSNIRLSRLQL